MRAEKTCKNKLDAFSQSDDDAVVVLCMTGMKSYLIRSIIWFLHLGKHKHQILCQRKQMVIKFPFLYVLQQNTRMVHVHVMANHSGHDSMIEYV